MKQTVAVFDFDGTLSNGECGPRFFRFFLGKKRYHLMAVLNTFWILLYLAKLGDEYAMNKVLTSVFKGKKYNELLEIAHTFSKEVMPHYIYDNIMQRLYWHQKQNHRCIIVTRSLELYMKPWGEHVAINDIIATKLEVTENGLFTGKIANHSYVGEKKLNALRALIGSEQNYITYAYGDSSTGDKYILAAADYAYWIRDPKEPIDKSLLDPKTHQQWKKECNMY